MIWVGHNIYIYIYKYIPIHVTPLFIIFNFMFICIVIYRYLIYLFKIWLCVLVILKTKNQITKQINIFTNGVICIRKTWWPTLYTIFSFIYKIRHYDSTFSLTPSLSKILAAFFYKDSSCFTYIYRYKLIIFLPRYLNFFHNLFL